MVEGTRLEIVQTRKGLVGSNPTSSAFGTPKRRATADTVRLVRAGDIRYAQAHQSEGDLTDTKTN